MPITWLPEPPTAVPSARESEDLSFALSVAEGLSARPRRLDSRYLYDARGRSLHDQVTRQPEYYLTRTEAGILEGAAEEIAALTAGTAVVELASGTSAKSSHLLSACSSCGPVRYYPVEADPGSLELAERRIQSLHDGVVVWPVLAPYEEALSLLPDLSPLLLLFLGSTIGTLDEVRLEDFLGTVANVLASGDYFLVGVDLAKDGLLLERAYNDAAGVTAALTLNIFARMNRELAAGLDLTAIRHVARYRHSRSRVEVCGRFTRRQVLRVPRLGTEFVVEAGEEIQVQINRKFSLDDLLPYLRSFGFTPRKVYTDSRGWFALILLQKGYGCEFLH